MTFQFRWMYYKSESHPLHCGVDFSTLTSFRPSIQTVDFTKFLRCHSLT